MAQQVRRVGTVRPSQLMYSFGVGAVIDLPRFSVITAGIDRWSAQDQRRITEERLLAAVKARVGSQVRELREAPWEAESRNPLDRWATIGVPVIPFPRWLRCTRCNVLSTVDSGLFKLRSERPFRPDLAQYEHSNCTAVGRPPLAVPARFVTACPAGHLDEFPWVEFCHAAGPCGGKPMLEAREVGSGSRSTDVQVVCTTCNARQHLSRAFGQSAAKTMPGCRGRHPHLQWFDPNGCSEQARAMLLGASNQWFPVTESVLSLPISTDALPQLVAELWSDLDRITSREILEYALSNTPALRPLSALDVGRVWDAMEERRGAKGKQPEEALNIRGPEWGLFADPAQAPQSRDFRLFEAGAPPGFENVVENVVLVQRLREVVALWGFTRVDGPDSGIAGDGTLTNIAPISQGGKPTWVPTAEVRGEGLFFRLPEATVDAWAGRVAGTPRMDALRASHGRWRSRHNMDPSTGWPGERYVLVHSLAHCLLNEVALECGYSAASIRERVYAADAGANSSAMAGFLLYTAAPDSEGTLGGLVSLGEPQSIARILKRALERARLCSGDPFCAEHLPSSHDDSLHNAACHACLFIPETSCERGNRYLDRSVLVDSLAGAGIEYFYAQGR